LDTLETRDELSERVAESVRRALALVGPAEGGREDAGSDGDEAA